MTPVVRATALRFLAVAIPVAVACCGWLTLLRLAGAMQNLGTWAWDVWMALALGAGSAIVHGATIRFAGLRPARVMPLMLAGLPLVVALSAAQAAYAIGAIDGGIEEGFTGLAALGRYLVASRGEALALVLGASVGFAFPLAYDARWRVLGERASPGPALAATLGGVTALLAMGGLAQILFWIPPRSHMIVAVGMGMLTLFVAGLPLTLLLAWASLYEDHLQGWRRSPPPVYRAG